MKRHEMITLLTELIMMQLKLRRCGRKKICAFNIATNRISSKYHLFCMQILRAFSCLLKMRRNAMKTSNVQSVSTNLYHLDLLCTANLHVAMFKTLYRLIVVKVVFKDLWSILKKKWRGYTRFFQSSIWFPWQRYCRESIMKRANIIFVWSCLKTSKRTGIVHDHCHYTELYWGVTHNNCNLKYKVSNHILIVFNNLSGCNAYLFI